MSSVKVHPCKACGKEVANSASTCPHCGQKQKMGVLAKLGIAFAVLVAIGLMLPKTETTAGTTSSEGKAEPTQAQQAQANPNDALPTFTSVEIGRAYDANTVAADAQFKDKRFKVVGTVTNISTDFTGDPYLELEGSDDFSSPQFGFNKDAGPQLAQLHKGSHVTLACTGRGDVMKTPMSDECQLLPEEAQQQGSQETSAHAQDVVQQSAAEAAQAAADAVAHADEADCQEGIDGIPAEGSAYEGGVYLCRESVDTYWNDWFAVEPTTGQPELIIKGEGKTAGFSGDLTVDCSSGRTSWSDTSNFDAPVDLKDVGGLVPNEVVAKAKARICHSA